MPRKLPTDEKGNKLTPELTLNPTQAPTRQRDENGWIELTTQVREYELITPLMGGGAKAGYPDLDNPVHAKAIRGHLRFWWRATRGGQYSTIAQLREAEINLWGAASTPKTAHDSSVQLQVKVTNKGSNFVHPPERDGSPVPLWHPSKSKYGYLAFPLKEKLGAQVLEKVSFTLAVTHPKGTEVDVGAALWAWETFGGIGARTRRGFGALNLRSVKVDGQARPIPALNDAQTHIKHGLAKHLVQTGSWPVGVPHLSNDPANYVVADGFDHALMAWEYLIEELKKFRQARNGKFGRSKWPEPDAIRHDTSHSPKHVPSATVPRKFPRAEFGLPILFQFKQDDVRAGDPELMTLEGASHNRLASRVILRPLKLANGQAVALAAVLEAPATPPGGLVLKGNFKSGVKTKGVSATLTNAEARIIQTLSGNPNVIEEFLRRL